MTHRIRCLQRAWGFCILALAVVPAQAALNLEQLWTADTHMVMEGSPMTADLNGDGDAEVITAAYENLIAVDGTGKELGQGRDVAGVGSSLQGTTRGNSPVWMDREKWYGMRTRSRYSARRLRLAILTTTVRWKWCRGTSRAFCMHSMH